MNYLHISVPCPSVPQPLMYASNAGKHKQPLEPVDGFPPGDRTVYMLCEYCGNVIWGYYRIEECPY